MACSIGGGALACISAIQPTAAEDVHGSPRQSPSCPARNRRRCGGAGGPRLQAHAVAVGRAARVRRSSCARERNRRPVHRARQPGIPRELHRAQRGAMDLVHLHHRRQRTGRRQGQRALADPAQRLDRAGAQVRRPADVAGDRAFDRVAEADDRDARAPRSAAPGRTHAHRREDGRHVRRRHLVRDTGRSVVVQAARRSSRTCCATSRDYQAQLDAWNGWHTIARPMRKDYVRFAALVNEGAKDMGFADAGELWRSGYDMPPAQIAAETDRLWGQVKPLYEQLHCYARTKLDAQLRHRQGRSRRTHAPGAPDGQHVAAGLEQPVGHAAAVSGCRQPRHHRRAAAAVPAGLRQRTVEAHRRAEPGAGRRDRARRAPRCRQADGDAARRISTPRSACRSCRTATGPRSQFIKPRDRDVVCHASAWDMDMAGDVRTKMCMQPDEDRLHHDLPRARPRLLRPGLQQAAADLPAGCARRLPRSHRRHDRAVDDAGVPAVRSAWSTRSSSRRKR